MLQSQITNRPKIFLRQNLIETFDNIFNIFAPSYDGTFYDVAQVIEEPIRQSKREKLVYKNSF